MLAGNFFRRSGLMVAPLLWAGLPARATEIFHDDFEQFTGGTVLTGTNYVPASGPSNVVAQFRRDNGTADVVVTNFHGSKLAYVDARMGDNNKYTGKLSAPVRDQVVTIDWNLWIEGTNSGWGGFAVNVPFAVSNSDVRYNPILLFHDGGDVGVYTNDPSTNYCRIGTWAAYAGQVMTNRLVLNYPARMLTLSVNGTVVTNLPIVSYFTNVFDAARFSMKRAAGCIASAVARLSTATFAGTMHWDEESGEA
jgi:hypothetical protein